MSDLYPYDPTFQAEEDWYGQRDNDYTNYDAWLKSARKLASTLNHVQFTLGDALVYGQRRFFRGFDGDSFYKKVAEDLGRDEESLRHLVYVARRVPACLR